MLHLAFAAALRVSELVTLRMDQLDQQTMASIQVMGKGRRERVLPLWKETATTLRIWLAVRQKNGDPELFLNAAGHAMTRSGFEYILAPPAEPKRPIRNQEREEGAPTLMKPPS